MSEALNGIVKKLQATSAVTAAATGGIHPKLPPETTTYPLVIVWPQKPPEGNRVFQQIAYEESVFLVKAVAKSANPKPAHDLNALIRTALDMQSITLATKSLISLVWLQDFDYVEYQNGVTYQHEGGFYQVTTT